MEASKGPAANSLSASGCVPVRARALFRVAFFFAGRRAALAGFFDRFTSLNS
jgi:hypothetical protein